MALKCTIKITLEIEGPFLCSATSPSVWGVDSVFDRDYKGEFYIDRSHIKGKLREATKELGEMNYSEIEQWFGKEGSDSDYSQNIGRLDFSDFKCLNRESVEIPETEINRIKIDSIRGVVEETALVALENAFSQGKVYKWEGEICFYENGRTKAEEIAEKIKIALRWITAFGSEKVIGFGRLINEKTEPSFADIPVNFTNQVSTDSWISLYIEALEPLLILETQKKTNYLESGEVIKGSMIKGALAEALNKRLNPDNSPAIPIDDNNAVVKETFPKLAAHYEKIRFTHAFPSLSDKRPVVIPYSIVESGTEYHDIAFCNEPVPINDHAPAFQIDYKGEGPAGFSWATPQRFIKTRTAIESETRRAEDEKLFTYQYVCPTDKDNNRIKWISTISLECIKEEDRKELILELFLALSWLDRIGKRRSRINVTYRIGKALPAQEMGTPISDNGYALITLQSDSLMINPDDLLSNNQTGEKLEELYKLYLDKISNNLFTLERFFAYQKLIGGHFTKRHQHKKPYYPFYLTGAGSVFVLKVTDNKNSEVEKYLDGWLNHGLPFPEWALKKYKDTNRPLWQTCPFIPENGFGEIAINLKWHWDKQYSSGEGTSEWQTF